MEFASADTLEDLLHSLEVTVLDLYQPDLPQVTVKRTIDRALAVVGGFTVLSQRFERAKEEASQALAVKRVALEEKESSLTDRQREIDEAMQALKSQEALGRLRDDTPQLPARIAEHDKDIKQKLMSFDAVLDGIKAGLITLTDKITALPLGTDASLSSLKRELLGGLEELKDKMLAKSGRSSGGSGSDQAASSPGLDNEHRPGITELQKRIQELETELRLSKQSQDQMSMDMISKKYLDDALEKITKKLDPKDRSGSSTTTDDRHHCVSQPRDNENRPRKRARVQQESSRSSEGSSSEGPEETTFRSTCSAIHEAMGWLHIVQPSRPDLSMAEIVNVLTQAFGFVDLEERVMNHIARGEMEQWFCFWEVAVSDHPSGVCRCVGPEGISPSNCLAMLVLNRNTMEVEFDLIDTESRA